MSCLTYCRIRDGGMKKTLHEAIFVFIINKNPSNLRFFRVYS